MNLVSTLCAGVAAAANGWAELYIRGSSTRAVWYPDLEASTSNSSGANITLDAYGSVEVYVNQLVDVVVKSPDGTIVRSFTEGHSAPVVEVISPAFTGNDYVTAAAAVNEPTTLQAVMDRWITNAGSPDWKVTIGGTATTMLNAFGALSGLVFNVKSPAYGAVGDGVTNDQTAIQAALAAAVAAGGGTVFFPKGTYLISTAIEWSHLVSILGVGGALSVITTNSASNARILTWTSGTAQNAPISITGMAFASTLANTGEQLYCNVAVNIVTELCQFGASATATGVLVNMAGTGSRYCARDCRFTINSGSNHAFTSATTAVTVFDNCLFITSSTSFAGSMIRPSGASDSIGNCTFNISSVTSVGTIYGVEMVSGGRLSVTGCKFVPLGQTFTACIKMMAGAIVTTAGNDYSFSVWYATLGAVLGDGSSLQLRSTNTSNTTAIAYTLADYGDVYDHTVSPAAASQAITMPNKWWVGQRFTLSIFNASGNNWTPSFPGLGSSTNTTIPLINTGSSAILNIVVTSVGWRLSNT